MGMLKGQLHSMDMATNEPHTTPGAGAWQSLNDIWRWKTPSSLKFFCSANAKSGGGVVVGAEEIYTALPVIGDLS